MEDKLCYMLCLLNVISLPYINPWAADIAVDWPIGLYLLCLGFIVSNGNFICWNYGEGHEAYSEWE